MGLFVNRCREASGYCAAKFLTAAHNYCRGRFYRVAVGRFHIVFVSLARAVQKSAPHRL